MKRPKSGNPRGGRRARRSAASRKAVPARSPAATRRKPGGRSRRRKAALILAERDIVRATARAEASLKNEMNSNPPAPPEDPAEAAIEEAKQIGMLLEEEEEEQEYEADESEDYFLKAPARGTARPRVRPSPDIVSKIEDKGRTARGPAAAVAAASPGAAGTAAAAGPGRAVRDRAGASPGEPGAPHLFPRNLRTTYPVAVRAAGVWIEDSAGRTYLDGCSGAVVCSIGHGVEEVARVMTEQAARLAFVHSSQFITRETMGLAARVAALCPGELGTRGRVYLVSGGSEAVETAIKMARQYHVETGRPLKSKIIGRWQSYHGSTLGALSATGNVARREIYTPLLLGMPHIPPCYCYRCPYGLKYPACSIACVEDLETAIRQEGPETVAAFIAEPIVGATLGAVAAVDGYWARAREICDTYKVLLIADEVMTGVGRTGRNFAVDHFKVVPDLLVTGKGLSGGYTPLGAVIARGFIADALRDGRGYFEHGFTYSANPLSAAIGSAVLDYIAKNRLIARAARMGRVLEKKLTTLRRHRIVGDVRGAGLLWGIELVKDRGTREPFPAGLKVARRLYELCLEEGLLIYPGSGSREGQDGDHFIVAPPFTISAADLTELVSRLDRALLSLAKELR